ncbi:MAG: TniQ family protein [Fimbriimonadaceae bacterium]|nr:TniQ family protein [Fimbriimonadaceae bacterium]
MRTLIGESLDSVCRRLAAANGITPNALLRQYSQAESRSEPLLHPVASALGIRAEELEQLTLIRVFRSTFPKRQVLHLRGEPWVCLACQSCGAHATLQRNVLQFLCIECGTLLSRPEDPTEPTQVVDVGLVELQREMLRQLDSSAAHHRVSMLQRLLNLAGAVGRQMVANEAWAQEIAHRVSATQPTGTTKGKRIGPLGIAEHPALTAEVWLRVWDLADSQFVSNLTLNALGCQKASNSNYLRNTPHPIPRLRACMPISPHAADTRGVGKRIREIVHDAKLRSYEVPDEIRYAHDPFIQDWHEWLWRRHICSSLRGWLSEIEQRNGILPRQRSYAEEVRYREGSGNRSPEWQTHRHWDVCATRYVGPEDAAAFVSQVLTLADELIERKPLDTADPRVSISETSLGLILPRRRSLSGNDIELVRYWMWLDGVFGEDAHGYLRTVSPQRLDRFDRTLLPEERLALREYRESQQAVTFLDDQPAAICPAIRQWEVG